MAETTNRRAQPLRRAAPFVLRSRHDADTWTITLFGKLDRLTAPALDRELADAATADPRVIVLDLRELVFIDRSGLQVIFDAHRRSGARLLVLRGPERVQHAFEVSGLLERLTFIDESAAHTAATSAIAGPTADRPTVSRGAQSPSRQPGPRLPPPGASCADAADRDRCDSHAMRAICCPNCRFALALYTGTTHRADLRLPEACPRCQLRRPIDANARLAARLAATHPPHANRRATVALSSTHGLGRASSSVA